MNGRLLYAAAVVTLAGAHAAAVQAHHSIAAVYDSTRHVTLEGRVTEFRFIYPHPVLVVEVRTPASDPEVWELEMDNRSELAAIGVKPDTFRPDDHVIASGSPARKSPRRLYLRRLDRPLDGLRYEQVGTRPEIDLPPRG